MSALNDYQQRTKEEVIKAINSLESNQTYLTNKKKRIELSQLYSRVKGLASPFPSASFTGGIPATLNKDVSESCPACVKSAIMTKTIESAKADLINYSLLLQGVDIESKQVEENKNIHELRPNLDYE